MNKGVILQNVWDSFLRTSVRVSFFQSHDLGPLCISLWNVSDSRWFSLLLSHRGRQDSSCIDHFFIWSSLRRRVNSGEGNLRSRARVTDGRLLDSDGVLCNFKGMKLIWVELNLDLINRGCRHLLSWRRNFRKILLEWVQVDILVLSVDCSHFSLRRFRSLEVDAGKGNWLILLSIWVTSFHHILGELQSLLGCLRWRLGLDNLWRDFLDLALLAGLSRRILSLGRLLGMSAWVHRVVLSLVIVVDCLIAGCIRLSGSTWMQLLEATSGRHSTIGDGMLWLLLNVQGILERLAHKMILVLIS